MSKKNNKGSVKQVLSQPKEEPKIMSEEEIIAQEEFINEPAEELVVEKTREEIINELVEEQASIVDPEEEKFLESTVEEIEAQPVVDEPCVCDETCVCDEPCTDPACTCEKSEEPVVVDPNTGNINVKFEFQDEYHFGPGNGDAVIDTLPEPEKIIVTAPVERVKKTFAQMTATELNIYHKTGIIPFV
jgi:hypothetical protein